MAKEYISIDVETTGLNPKKNKIVEFGAVKFDEEGNIVSEFQALANPGGFGIPNEVIDIHGIDDDMVEGKPSPVAVWNSLLDWADNCNSFVAHNASFECGFIQELYSDPSDIPGLFFIDTLKISRRQLNDRSSYKLSSLVPSLKSSEAHRALPDAKACMELFLELAGTYKNGKVPKSQEKPIAEYDFFEENKPSHKQLSYIEGLGGDPDLVNLKSEASEYIDELKGKTSSVAKFNKTANLAGRAGHAIATVIGFIFVLSGGVSILANPLSGLSILIAGLLILPVARKKVYVLTKTSISGKVRFLLVFICFIANAIFMTSSV